MWNACTPSLMDVASGAYLGNKGGGCLVAGEARRDFGHAPFTAQESDVNRNIT